MMHLLRIRMCCLLIVIWKANWTCALCKYSVGLGGQRKRPRGSGLLSVPHMLILHRHIYNSCLAPQHTMSVAGTLSLDSFAPDHSNPAPIYVDGARHVGSGSGFGTDHVGAQDTDVKKQKLSVALPEVSQQEVQDAQRRALWQMYDRHPFGSPMLVSTVDGVSSSGDIMCRIAKWLGMLYQTSPPARPSPSHLLQQVPTPSLTWLTYLPS